MEISRVTVAEQGQYGTEWMTTIVERSGSREHTWVYLSLTKPLPTSSAPGTVVSHISQGIAA